MTNIKHALIKNPNINNTLATQPLIYKIKPLSLGLMVFAAPQAIANESASNELVLDSGFELQVLAEGAVANTSHTWALKTGSRSGLINPTGVQYADEAAHQNVAFVNARGKIAQNLGASLELGKTYTISMDVGWSNEETLISYQARFLVGNAIIPIAMTGAPKQGQFITATGSL